MIARKVSITISPGNPPETYPERERQNALGHFC